MDQKPTSLDEMLDRIEEAAGKREKVSLGAVIEEVGSRSFGPLLLVAGVIASSPLTGIPGVPTAIALLVALLSAQLLIHRKHFWLPGWLLRRSLDREKTKKAVEWLRPPARFTDRWLRPRLQILVHPAGVHVIALVCLFIAMAMPLMELVPLSAHAAGVALSAFGLSLLARDGLLALMAFLTTSGVLGFLSYNLLLL